MRRTVTSKVKLLSTVTSVSPTVQADFTTLNASTTPAWLTVSRTGNAMMTDSTGKLAWANCNGFKNSQDFTASDWVKFSSADTGVSSGFTAPDGSSTACKLYEATTTSNYHEVYQSPTTIPYSANRIFSFYAKAAERSYVQISEVSSGKLGRIVVDISTGGGSSGTVTQNTSSLTVNVVDAGNSWWRLSVFYPADGSAMAWGICLCNASTSASGAGASYAGTVNSGIYIWGAQLEAVTTATTPSTYVSTTSSAYFAPRYDYDGSVSPATARGLLIEQTRTNLQTYCNAFNNVPWSTLNASINTNSTTAPDETSTASKLLDTSATGRHAVFAANTLTAANYTFSVYAKAAEYNYVKIGIATTGTTGVYFNLSNGTVGTADSGFTGAITKCANGWYRCSVTYLGTAASYYNQIMLSTNGSDAASFTGNGTSGVYIWGSMLELGSFSTSFIPTVSTSVARAADSVTLAGSALTVAGADTGTAIIQTSLWEGAGDSTRFLLASSSSRALLYSSSSNTIISSTNGTSLSSIIGSSGSFTGGPVRAGIAWSSAGRTVVANNGTPATDSINLSTGATVYLGGATSTPTFNGWVASMALYNTKLSNSALKVKTNVGAAY